MARNRQRPTASKTPKHRGLVALLSLALLAGAVSFALFGRGVSGVLRTRRSNVLLVTIDTLRWDRLGCYGDKAAATPNLDALAAGGVRFATAVAHIPLTTPSHASILTGLTPLRHGIRDNGDFALPESIPTLAEAFAREGYRTAAFVSGFPLDRRFGLARGFATYDDRLPRGDDARRSAYVERPADQTTQAVLRFLDRAAEPWFLWVHYFDPHAPYQPPAEFAERFRERLYDGEVAFVDAQIGRLLGRLKTATDRTLILVTADHGEGLGEHQEDTHGVFLYDSTLRVPWIMAGPGLSPGRVVTTVARAVDVSPTLAQWSGIPLPTGVDGRSVLAAARGRKMEDAPAYAESLFARRHLGWAPLHAWRTAGFKLIEAPRPELFDLKHDQAEIRDRFADSPSVAASLRDPLRSALATRSPTARVEIAPDASERLAALGYLGGGVDTATPSLRDPKDGAALLNRLWQGVTDVRARPADAARVLTQVLAEEPRAALARRYLAMAKSASGDATGAIREIAVLEREGVAGFEDLMLLADGLRKVGRSADALSVLDRAERLQPRAVDVALTRARVLSALGRRDQVAAQYQHALTLAPDHTEALRGLGEQALQQGDLATAAARLERVLDQEPDDVGALVKLGVVRVRSGRLPEAIALFERAVALDPRNPEALLDLGGALAKSGQPAAAVPYLERALEVGPRSPLALNSLGFARLESGDRPGALAALRASVALDPRQSQIAAVIADLEGKQP